MSIIYETSGRAREDFELAANLYSGCVHGCRYCYGADVTRKDPKEFYGRAVPKHNVLEELERDAAKFYGKKEMRHVLLSFVTDPYQPLEDKVLITRQALQILHRADLAVAILTKGGLRAIRDFDLLTTKDRLDILSTEDLFGVTLTFTDTVRGQSRSRVWEPGAASPHERIASLKEAHSRGIPTWVSLEPVIDPGESLVLIETTAKFVDVFKVGTLNYPDKLPWELRDQVRGTDWKNFAQNAVLLLDSLKANYYIKKDLARHIGRPEGISKGDIPK